MVIYNFDGFLVKKHFSVLSQDVARIIEKKHLGGWRIEPGTSRVGHRSGATQFGV